MLKNTMVALYDEFTMLFFQTMLDIICHIMCPQIKPATSLLQPGSLS